MVKAYEKSHNATEVARNFSVSRSTVYDHVNQMRETGSVAVQTSKRGRKPILSQQQLDKIAETITNQPNISIHEIKEKLALPVSEENIREKVVQMGFVYKKKSLHASERERSRCGHPAKRMDNKLPKLNKNKLVFLDESGVNTDMTRIYGRSLGGSRCVDKAPLIKPQSTTILSSVRLNGETAFTTYQGGTTCERFIDYLKNVLAPTLEPDDIVVMDNMRTHHSKAVKKVIDELKINVIYLPPYSPDFNPIENMWSKIKAILRKLKVRVLSELSSAIKYAFSLVSNSDCLGWFSAAGL